MARVQLASGLLLLALASAGCGSPVVSDGVEPPPGAVLTAVEISPAGVTLDAGATRQFSATGRFSDGSSGSVAVAWSATGGSISSGGLYTAGTTPGTYRVIASAASLADTVSVTVAASSVSLVGIEISPTSLTLETGATQAFSAVGRLSNGATQSVAVTWTATGGTISSSGLYTAGTAEGTYRVIATAPGGAPADTTQVVLFVPGAGISPALEMNFSQYAGTADLRAAITGGTGPWLALDNNVQQISLVTGPSAPGVSSDRFMRYTWPGTNAGARDYTIRAIISALPAGRELWIEVWSRFSAGWRNAPANAQYYDYKYMLLLSNGGSRYNLQMLGENGNNTQWGFPGNEAAWTNSGNGSLGRLQSAFSSSEVWDGNWHRWRYHVRTSSASGDATGIATFAVDGRVIHRGTGLRTTPSSGFSEFEFGANMNSAVDRVQTLDWASLRVYTADPGWGF